MSHLSIRCEQPCCAAQDNILNSIACHALARMAYIAPDLVLPIMHERFEVGTGGLDL